MWFTTQAGTLSENCISTWGWTHRSRSYTMGLLTTPHQKITEWDLSPSLANQLYLSLWWEIWVRGSPVVLATGLHHADWELREGPYFHMHTQESREWAEYSSRFAQPQSFLFITLSFSKPSAHSCHSQFKLILSLQCTASICATCHLLWQLILHLVYKPIHHSLQLALFLLSFSEMLYQLCISSVLISAPQTCLKCYLCLST